MATRYQSVLYVATMCRHVETEPAYQYRRRRRRHHHHHLIIIITWLAKLRSHSCISTYVSAFNVI